jgi:hypothetical protein
MSMEALVTALLDLAAELPELPTPVLVGGGFGLYLKQLHLEEQDVVDTLFPPERWAPARATEDIDLLLPTEIIVSSRHMRSIRNALDRLAYKPEVEHFQFTRNTSQGRVKIDFLTCDVSREQRSKTRIKPPRVQPVEKVQLHAYLTKEALALGHAPFELTLNGFRSSGEPATLRVYIPNPFTYLLMKLHAFHDRLNDERKNLAAHHAVDIYRIISMLTRDEFELVKSLAASNQEAKPVINAALIVGRAFGTPDSVGVLRLKSGLTGAGSLSDDQVHEFISSLKEFFSPKPAL